jgi:hypothetical protein
MERKKLVTLAFERNVGPKDRIWRLVIAGWELALPLWASTLLCVLGGMWFLTGVLSKCSIYYLLGVSTRRASGG